MPDCYRPLTLRLRERGNDIVLILANSVTLLFSLPILFVKSSNKLAGRE